MTSTGYILIAILLGVVLLFVDFMRWLFKPATRKQYPALIIFAFAVIVIVILAVK
jgi:hypothetical protein